MINFFDFEIKRAIAHTLIAKETNTPNAALLASDTLLELDENVKYTFLERLGRTTDKITKTFELKIENSHPNSFFYYAEKLSTLSDENFINFSKEIAKLLAENQNSAKIPGGYVIILDAEKVSNGKKCVIVIKAELQDALIYYENSIRLLENIFLSPQQKLFKYALLFELSEDEIAELEEEFEYPNNLWGAIVYDEQFRIDSKPAEYFYRGFLGLTTKNNSIIESKRFYDKTEKFIKNYYEDFREKDQALKHLNNQFFDDSNWEIKPKEYAENNIKNNDLKKQYENEILINLPESFEKNPSLLKSNLTRKQIVFPENIKISGPLNSMEANLEIIDSEEELSKLSSKNSTYTIVKIFGKPYSKD